MDFAKDVADRILFFDQGQIIEQGPPEKIFSNPESERLQTFLTPRSPTLVSNKLLGDRHIKQVLGRCIDDGDILNSH